MGRSLTRRKASAPGTERERREGRERRGSLPSEKRSTFGRLEDPMPWGSGCHWGILGLVFFVVSEGARSSANSVLHQEYSDALSTCVGQLHPLGGAGRRYGMVGMGQHHLRHPKGVRPFVAGPWVPMDLTYYRCTPGRVAQLLGMACDGRDR